MLAGGEGDNRGVTKTSIRIVIIGREVVVTVIRIYLGSRGKGMPASRLAKWKTLAQLSAIFLYILPVQAKWMLPISAGITVLFMLMTSWFAYLPQLFGLGAGVLFAGGVPSGNVFLRAKVWWIDRKLRRSRLRVIRGEDDVRSGSRGSDKYLH